MNTAWLSKINWTQALGVLASVFVVFGIDVPPETQVAAVTGIQGTQAVLTWVFRTWFTAK